MADVHAWVSMVLLFTLIFGLSGTVEPAAVLGQFRRLRPLLVGMAGQFVLLPLCGALTALVLGLEAPLAVPLLLTTSSPGGSFSNFWCALANADLSLSVAMTTVSTIAALAMLPLNVVLYVEVLLGSTGVDVPFTDLLPPLGVVVGAVLLGLLAAHCFPSRRTWFNRLGGIGGVCLVLFALFSPGQGGKTDSKVSPELYRPILFAAVTLPCVLGLVLTTALATLVPGISRPERTTLSIETCFQNTSIALAVAMQTPDNAEGIAIPLLYGAMEVVCISIWAFFAWRLGYTYAPPSDNFCRVLLDNYQPRPVPATVIPDPSAAPSGAQADPCSPETPARCSADLEDQCQAPSMPTTPSAEDDEARTCTPSPEASKAKEAPRTPTRSASLHVLGRMDVAKLWRRRTLSASLTLGPLQLPEAWAGGAEKDKVDDSAPPVQRTEASVVATGSWTQVNPAECLRVDDGSSHGP